MIFTEIALQILETVKDRGITLEHTQIEMKERQLFTGIHVWFKED